MRQDRDQASTTSAGARPHDQIAQSRHQLVEREPVGVVQGRGDEAAASQ